MLLQKIFHKLSNGLQIDRLCACGSQVIDVYVLGNYRHLKSRGFQFLGTERVNLNYYLNKEKVIHKQLKA